jgi:hypothetical protein
MSGVTSTQRSARSTAAGRRMLPWLNIAVALSITSKITTATTGGPSTAMVANLISIDRMISSG